MLGWLKRTLLTILFVIILVLLIIGNLFFVLTLSLQYENVKGNLGPYIQEILNEKYSPAQVGKFYDAGESICSAGVSQNFVLQVAPFDSKYNFPKPVLTCDEISELNETTVLNYAIDKSIYTYYYSQEPLNCSFISCTKEIFKNPLFLLSDEAHDFFLNKLLWFYGLAVLILFGCFFLFSEKNDYFVYGGILIMLSAVPFMKINLFFNSSEIIILNVMSVLLSEARLVFLIMLVIGLILAIGGVVWGLMKKKPKESVEEKKN